MELAPDGRWLHTFRQSTLNELDMCPERGRATMSGEMPDQESDAACLGTAVHFGIERALRSEFALDPYTIEELGQQHFSELIALPEFEWIKYKEERAREYISACLFLFYEDIYHTLAPVLLEQGFGPFVIHEDDERVIQVTGSIDLFDQYRGACDWKTDGDGRKFRRGFGGKAWELDRWAIQPTVYVHALRELGYYTGDGPWPFTYLGFDISGKPADVELVETPVMRQRADSLWLVEKTLAYAKLVEADIKPWPKHDNHALCSPKWCPHWGNCKGAAYSDVKWPLKVARQS